MEEINPQNTNWVDTSEVHEKNILVFLFFFFNKKERLGIKCQSHEKYLLYIGHFFFSVVELTGLEQGLEQCHKEGQLDQERKHCLREKASPPPVR